MEQFKCSECGKEFTNEQSLKIHVGRMHGKSKAKAGRKAKKVVAPAPAAKGGIVCDVCGRSFKLAAHLARHKSTSHKAAAGKRVAKKVAKPKAQPAKATGIDVASLSVDKLLTLKGEVDARLAEIVALMRKMNVKV